MGQDQPLPRSAERHLTPAVGHLEGTEQPELEMTGDRVRTG